MRLVYGTEEFVDGDGHPVGRPLPGSGRTVPGWTPVPDPGPPWCTTPR
ncbi:hypothetical protein [Actinomadura spongiicola]|nr:hypothetical protein [Actinomadura spongiicola]